MVAVAQAPPAQIRRLVLVGTTPAVRYPAARIPAATYRRRRAVVAVAAAGVLVAFVFAVHALFGSFAGGAGTPTARPAVSGSVYVVQPGDTFWGIALALRPSADPRPLVDRLVAAHGSPVLVAGERIPVPAGA